MLLKLQKKNKKKIIFKLFDSESLNQAHKRIFFSTLVFILIYISILIKLTNVMVISNLSKELDTKNIGQTKIYDRGSIYDRNGQLLAKNVRSYSLSARPNKIIDKKNTAFMLSKILGFEEKILFNKLNSNAHFVWIKRDISPIEHKKINKIGEIGLEIVKERRRLYPQNKLTSHVVGFTNIDEIGLSGIEKGLNKNLERNNDVILSIDLRLQNIANEELQKQISKFNASGGLSLIMKIDTGEILASVSLPNFDPNNINYHNSNDLFNSVTQGVYEMGSTFKPITMAIGFDTDIINEESTFYVSDPIKIDNKIIKDHSPKTGYLTIREIVVNSSNIATAIISQLIGKKNQKKYLSNFGLFEKQITEIPETEKPLIPNYWGNAATATIGYGYGLSITPLQLCSVYGALVNGGLLINPTFIKISEVKNKKRVIKKETSEKVKGLLRAVVLETKYAGPSAKAIGYEVAGKTGTTEMMTEKGYHKKANLSSFIGVFPISEPKYLIYTMIKAAEGKEETQFQTTGGWIAAPVVGKIIRRMINTLGIKPIEQNLLFENNI